MKIEIKSWMDGRILFEGEFGSMRICIEAAIKSRANLSRADLSGANLSGADLSGAYLSWADLNDIKDAAVALARTSIVPQTGSFVGWKKLTGNTIAKVLIPEDAARVNAAGSRKCRASRVHVLAMWQEGTEMNVGVAVSGQHDVNTKYEVGKEVVPDSFDARITEECSHGIHFFLTREEAEAY